MNIFRFLQFFVHKALVGHCGPQGVGHSGPLSTLVQKILVAVITAVMKTDDEMCVDFRKSNGSQFILPEKRDSATVHINDMLMLLPSLLHLFVEAPSEHLSISISL